MNNITDDNVTEFLKGKGFSLEVSTVGELKQVLDLLPDDFNIEQGFSKGVAVTIYKRANTGKRMLDFDDAETYTGWKRSNNK